MDDVSTTIAKQTAMKWFETDHSDDPAFDIKDYEFLTIPRYFINIKKKVPLEYIRYTDWQRMVKDLCGSKKIAVITVKDSKPRYLTTKEAEKVDGRETWMIVASKVN